MKYILALLVVIGFIIALFGVVFLITRVSEKIDDFHWGLKRKHPKYAKFSEFMNDKFMPWAVGIIMILLLLFGLVCGYLAALKLFS